MLSILIPIYNFDVRSFVKELHLQAVNENVLFEILLVDDTSEMKFQKINPSLNELEFVSYIQLKENIGRSKIRNLLAEKAKYKYLLFADCDSEIPNSTFIKKYIDNCEGEKIICGGRIYNEQPPNEKELFFRWFYGINREVVNAEERNKFPNKSFMTNNYLISKSIHERIKFDEEISQYGHEDTLFGIELKRKGLEINHIYNPLVHIGLEQCEKFISKTKKGIDNLVYIINNYNYPELFEDIKLLKTYKRTASLSFLFNLYFKLFSKLSEKKFCRKKVSLKLFDLYKLSYLHSVKNW